MTNSTAIKALSAQNNGGESRDREKGMAKSSGTSARGRRLLKLREEKHRREHERLNNYPAWAKYSSFYSPFLGSSWFFLFFYFIFFLFWDEFLWLLGFELSEA